MQFTATQKSVAAWGAIAAFIVFFLWLLAPVLTPFVVAAVFAYALTPLVDRLDRKHGGKLPRLLAVLLVQLLLFFVLAGVALLIVPILAKELPILREQIPVLFDRFNAFAKPLFERFGIGFSLDVSNIKEFVVKYLNANFGDAFGSMMASLKLGGSVAFALIGNAVLIPVALFYLLMDWHRFVASIMDIVPPRMRESVDSFTSEANLVLGQYLRGQLLVMLILAAFYSIGLALFGLDLALPIGVFTGLAVFVPYLGFGFGLILATLAGVLEFSADPGPAKAVLMVAVVYGLGQLLESLYLTPRLLGERIGLHPLVVIFALLAFGQLLGFVGVLIALPASAVLLVAIRRAFRSYQGSDLYKGDLPA